MARLTVSTPQAMSQAPTISRRQLIRYLVSAPMLPWTSNVAAAPQAPKRQYQSARFVPMAAPSLANPAAMATTSVASRLEISYTDGSLQSYQLAYQPFFVSGDQVPDGKGGMVVSGGYFDRANQAIMDRTVPGKARQLFSDCPDGTSLLQLPQSTVPGIRGKAVFAVVQFEYTSRRLDNSDPKGLPCPLAVLTLDQDQRTGKLKLVQYHNVDTSQVHGLWNTCGASLSPWNTHLSSEEYEPDAPFAAQEPWFLSFSKNWRGDATLANPYHYGHLPEVTVHPDGSGTVKKHYCMGRISHELIQVMPDQRTALMGDDATNSGLFLFVADTAQDLSAGSLYVAQLGPGFSINPQDAGARIRWIHLGHATSAEIEHMANTLKPEDIMTVLKNDPQDARFTPIFVSGVANWVQLKPGMEKAAAFLETHRYAYLVGGSLGFTKMEGTTVNVRDKIAYSAMQNLQDSMVKHGKGWTAASGIALDRPVVSGGIFAHTLAGGQRDTGGNVIHSEWVPTQTRALLIGQDMPADALGNTAHPDHIANPDNLKFSEKMRTLFIGEDSSTHVNNFVWAYHVDTQHLARVMSMPVGAEATGLGVVDDLNGWTYITANFQHPGDWIPALHHQVQATLEPLVRARYKDRFGAAVGYVTAEQTSVHLG